MESGKLLWNDGVNVDNPAVPAVEFDHVSLTYKGAAENHFQILPSLQKQDRRLVSSEERDQESLHW